MEFGGDRRYTRRAVVTPLVRHAMKALYPRTDALPGIEDCDLDGFLARYRRESSTLMWIGLVLGAVVFAWTPLLTVYLPVPSFFLPRTLLDRHAFRITYSRLYLVRQAVFLVKLAAGMCWGQDPKVRERFALSAYPDDPGTWREA